MVQSLEVEGAVSASPKAAGRSVGAPGWGLRETNTIRILERGQTCSQAGETGTAGVVSWARWGIATWPPT